MLSTNMNERQALSKVSLSARWRVLTARTATIPSMSKTLGGLCLTSQWAGFVDFDALWLARHDDGR